MATEVTKPSVLSTVATPSKSSLAATDTVSPQGGAVTATSTVPTPRTKSDAPTPATLLLIKPQQITSPFPPVRNQSSDVSIRYYYITYDTVRHNCEYGFVLVLLRAPDVALRRRHRLSRRFRRVRSSVRGDPEPWRGRGQAVLPHRSVHMRRRHLHTGSLAVLRSTRVSRRVGRKNVQ